MDKAKLRELAEKASQGMWCASADFDYDDDCPVTTITTMERLSNSMVEIASLKYTDGMKPEDSFCREQCHNAAFMAAANPQTVLAMIAENELLDKEVVYFAKLVQDYAFRIDRYQKEIEKLGGHVSCDEQVPFMSLEEWRETARNVVETGQETGGATPLYRRRNAEAFKNCMECPCHCREWTQA